MEDIKKQMATNGSGETSLLEIEETPQKQNTGLVFFRRLMKEKGAAVGLVIVLVLVVLALLSPWIIPYPYDEINLMEAFQGPSAKHWFGTDNLGRDIFSRLLYGARFSLLIGFGAATVSHLFGMILGAIAGFFGGTVDNVIMRFCDVFQSIPGIIMNIVLVCALGNGMDKTILALGLSATPNIARIMRSSILKIRKMEYINAAESVNCPSMWIILRHAVPNALSPIIVNYTMGVASAIISTVTLSYIGLGVQPPLPEWGAMLTAGKEYILTYPYLCLFPGLMIMITVLGLNMLGDGIRDASDPRLKK